MKILLILIAWAASVEMYGQQVDSLATYIEAAIRNNPSVMAQYEAYRAKVMDACGEGQLSDPELSVGIFPKAMNHVNAKQLATFSVMQMFPWFGTLKAGRQVMEHEAEAQYQQFRENGIALAFDVQRQWYQMLALQEQIKSILAKEQLLKDIAQVQLYGYKSPSAASGKMSDQLRLEAEGARLQQQRESLTDRLTLMTQQFNLTMHRSPDAPVALSDTLLRREMPVVAWGEIENASPALQRLTAEGKKQEAREAKINGMGKPMIGVGLEYMLNGKVDHPMMADMNGNDMLMPMVKVSLPIYRRRTNAGKRSAQMMKASAALAYQGKQDELRAEWLSIAQRAADEERKLKLYDHEEELLNRTLKLMTSEYANGQTSLTDILQTTREQIDYALKRAEAYAAYNTLVAEYEKLASRYDFAVRTN